MPIQSPTINVIDSRLSLIALPPPVLMERIIKARLGKDVALMSDIADEASVTRKGNFVNPFASIWRAVSEQSQFGGRPGFSLLTAKPSDLFCFHKVATRQPQIGKNMAKEKRYSCHFDSIVRS